MKQQKTYNGKPYWIVTTEKGEKFLQYGHDRHVIKEQINNELEGKDFVKSFRKVYR